jgi:hypothetical protein
MGPAHAAKLTKWVPKKEEAKKDYDEERLDKWYAQLDKLRQERRDIEEQMVLQKV